MSVYDSESLSIYSICHARCQATAYLIVWVAQLCESIHVQQAGVGQLAVGVHHLLALQVHTHLDIKLCSECMCMP